MHRYLFSLLFLLCSFSLSAQHLTSAAMSARGTTLAVLFSNPQAAPGDFDMGVGIFHPEGYITPLAYNTGMVIERQFFYLSQKLPLIGENDILVPIARAVGAASWHITLPPSTSHFKKTQDQRTPGFSVQRGRPLHFPLLEAQFRPEAPLKAGSPSQLHVELSNQGYAPFAGKLYVKSSVPSELPLPAQSLELTIGARHTLTWNYMSAQIGEVQFTISLDEAGQKVVARHSMQVEAGSVLAVPSPRHAQAAPVYDLRGQRVGMAQRDAQGWQLPNLPRGLYLVEGKRVIR